MNIECFVTCVLFLWKLQLVYEEHAGTIMLVSIVFLHVLSELVIFSTRSFVSKGTLFDNEVTISETRGGRSWPKTLDVCPTCEHRA